MHRSRYRPRTWGDYEADDLKEIYGVSDIAQLSRQQVHAIRSFHRKDRSEVWFYVAPEEPVGATGPAPTKSDEVPHP